MGKSLRPTSSIAFRRTLAGLVLLIGSLLAACSAGPAQNGDQASTGLEPVQLRDGERLQALASTSLVGEVVRRVGGETIEVEVLLPLGIDPHGYIPTPEDLRRANEADVVFINGFGLEQQLLLELASAAPATPVVSLSQGIDPLRLAGEHDHEQEQDHEQDEAHSQAADGGGAEADLDPHVWFDPLNVAVWSDNAAQALAALDPMHADSYQGNAARYKTELAELDRWIQEQVERIPEQDRELVTDHLVFGYFARRYGFEMIGAVVPGASSAAEPSARALAELQRLIEQRGVKAIFVTESANRALARQIASDLDLALVELYVESLSGPEGPAPTYLELMRYNVGQIVAALS